MYDPSVRRSDFSHRIKSPVKISDIVLVFVSSPRLMSPLLNLLRSGPPLANTGSIATSLTFLFIFFHSCFVDSVYVGKRGIVSGAAFWKSTVSLVFIYMDSFLDWRHHPIEEGKAASKSPHYEFGYFLSIFPSKQFLPISQKIQLLQYLNHEYWNKHIYSTHKGMCQRENCPFKI